MTKDKFLQLKPGDQFTLVDDGNIIVSRVGGPSYWAGRSFSVSRVDFSNNRVYFRHPETGAENYVDDMCIKDSPSRPVKAKPVSYGRRHIETMFNEGGNTRLRGEMTTLVHSARNSLQTALVTTPKDLFKDSMDQVDQQIAHIKALHRSLRK